LAEARHHSRRGVERRSAWALLGNTSVSIEDFQETKNGKAKEIVGIMPIFINGQLSNIPLAQLVAEGKEIIERENIPPSSRFDLDLWAASVAVSPYDEAHRVWSVANEDEHMRAIRSQAQENVRMSKAIVEAKRMN